MKGSQLFLSSGTVLWYEDVLSPEGRLVERLRREQDTRFYGSIGDRVSVRNRAASE